MISHTKLKLIYSFLKQKHNSWVSLGEVFFTVVWNYEVDQIHKSCFVYKIHFQLFLQEIELAISQTAVRNIDNVVTS